jgi:hypothetical protein
VTQLMDETQRAFLRRADALSKLPLIPGFKMLVEEMENKRQRMQRTLMSRVMAEGMTGDAIQRQADYDRGFVDGMRYAVVEVPHGAEIRLARQDASEPEEEEVEDLWA